MCYVPLSLAGKLMSLGNIINYFTTAEPLITLKFGTVHNDGRYALSELPITFVEPCNGFVG